VETDTQTSSSDGEEEGDGEDSAATNRNSGSDSEYSDGKSKRRSAKPAAQKLGVSRVASTPPNSQA